MKGPLTTSDILCSGAKNISICMYGVTGNAWSVNNGIHPEHHATDYEPWRRTNAYRWS